MRWFQKIPIVGGWYWVKDGSSKFIEYITHEGQMWNTVYEEYQDVDSECEYWFCGPIEEP